MNLFQIVFVPLCTLAALHSLIRLRRGQTGWLAGWFWFAVWAGGAVIIAHPPITTAVASAFGITRGTDFVLYLLEPVALQVEAGGGGKGVEVA